MSLILPISAAILQAASFTIDKFTLLIKRVTYKTYIGISFPLAFLFTLIIFLMFKPPLTLELFAGKYLWLLILSIILIIGTNVIFYRALKSDLLSEIQTISLITNIPLIIFAAFIFTDERNILIILLALITIGSVIWSHWEKGHFKIAKKTFPFLVWALIVAPFSGIISKILLEIWNPISLELVRNGAIAFLFIFMFFKSIKSVPKKALPLLLLTNLLTTTAWILYFFSFKILGITQTVLIFSLQPLLVYFSSVYFLKEEFHWKKFAAFIIILVAIFISQIFK